MALTALQRNICRLIAQNRIESGESYVAGGVALNLVTGGTRISRDIDLFHDTVEALQSTWLADQALLTRNGYDFAILRERPNFVEARVTGRTGREAVLMQWVQDSAYRFYPLVRDDDLGLTLHPLDLAINKLLAAVGRLEVRDWIDLIQCHDRIQRLGYLAWAAPGKDPGFSPQAILAESARSSHYSEAEVAELAFDGIRPDIRALSQSWRGMLGEAEQIVSMLPAGEVGRCVLDGNGGLFQGGIRELGAALASGSILFHTGSIRGAFPRVLPA